MKRKWMMMAVPAGVVAAAAFAVVPAKAQLSNMMPSMPSMGSLTGGAGLPSVGSASPTNLAGVLQYCVQNNYLGGASASSAGSVKDSLLNKFTGSSTAPSNDSAYSAGSNGVLDTGNGQTASLAGGSLAGGGLKAEATQKVCSMVLSHAKSLI